LLGQKIKSQFARRWNFLLTKSIARFTKFQKLPPILSGVKQLKFHRFARKDLITQEIKSFSQTNFSQEAKTGQ